MVLKLDLVFKMLHTLGPVYTVFKPSECVGFVSVAYLIFILELFHSRYKFLCGTSISGPSS